jgi:hypothetical protein
MKTEEGEGQVTKSVIKSNKEMPETPDLSYRPLQLQRQDPFILADFSGSNAYKGTKP